MSSPTFDRHGLPTAVFDVHEAAAYLAVSETTLHRMLRRGELPHTRAGRSLRFRVVDLDRYLEEQTSRTWKAHTAGSLGSAPSSSTT
jgi:excisionase family DNA binding protein